MLNFEVAKFEDNRVTPYIQKSILYINDFVTNNQRLIYTYVIIITQPIFSLYHS